MVDFFVAFGGQEGKKGLGTVASFGYRNPILSIFVLGNFIEAPWSIRKLSERDEERDLSKIWI